MKVYPSEIFATYSSCYEKRQLLVANWISAITHCTVLAVSYMPRMQYWDLYPHRSVQGFLALNPIHFITPKVTVSSEIRKHRIGSKRLKTVNLYTICFLNFIYLKVIIYIYNIYIIPHAEECWLAQSRPLSPAVPHFCTSKSIILYIQGIHQIWCTKLI